VHDGRNLGRLHHPLRLQTLNIEKQSGLDLTTVLHHRELTRLTLWDCTGPIDLAPLADLDTLTVRIDDSTDATGLEHLPPGRLNTQQ